MEDSGSLGGKLLPLLVFLAIAGVQAWLKHRKQKNDTAEKVPTKVPAELRRSEHLSPRKTEGSAPGAMANPVRRKADDFRLRADAAPAPEATPIAPVTEALARRRPRLLLGPKQLRAAILHKEILTPRHF
ncbi:MAG: hypothetical protein J0L75_17740 [Spirochaetes bacterium]|nr:hypothetical protein [Spirochaetota bacterium]